MNQSCPFCGSTKLKLDSKRTKAHGDWIDGKYVSLKHCSVSVRCSSCHARGPVAGIYIPDGKYNERELCEQSAYDAWNKRI